MVLLMVPEPAREEGTGVRGEGGGGRGGGGGADG